MQDAAPGLIAKVGTHNPLIVCFVGKVIWNNVEQYLVKVSKEKKKRVPKHPFKYDLQPYKLVYSEDIIKGWPAVFPDYMTIANETTDRTDPRDVILRGSKHICQGCWV